MSSNLLRVVQEQQETIEKQSRLIADLIATLESWEQTASYDGAELKERAKDLQLRERHIEDMMQSGSFHREALLA